MSCFSLAFFLVVLSTCLAFGLASISDGHNDFSFVNCKPGRLQLGEALLALLFFGWTRQLLRLMAQPLALPLFWADSTASRGSAFGLASFLGGLGACGVSWLSSWPRLFFE